MKKVFAVYSALALGMVLWFLGPATALAMTCPQCGSNQANTIIGGPGTNEPTCTEDGHALIWCRGHSGYAMDSAGNNIIVITPAYGHDWQFQGGVEPTCTRDGFANYTCTRCLSTLVQPLPALGHDLTCEITEPACTEAGLEHCVCSRCEFTEDLPLAALGHSLEVSVKEPTCLEAGTETFVCTRCTFTETKELDALGHQWSQTWIVETQPTSFKTGLEYHLCDRCGDREERSIPKLPLTGTTGGIILIIIGGLLVVTGLFFGWKKIAAKGLSKTPKGLELPDIPDLTEKNVLSLLEDNSAHEALLGMIASKAYLGLTSAFGVEDLGPVLEEAEPDVVLIEADGEAGLQTALDRIAELRTSQEDLSFGLLVAKGDGLTEKLDGLVKDGTILSYAFAESHPLVQFARLVAPVYKDTYKDTETLKAVGQIADLMGIPVVSAVTGALVTRKRVKTVAGAAKTALQGEDMTVEDGVSVVKAIASLAGLETLGGLAELAEDSLETRNALKVQDEDSTNVLYKERGVAMDLADLVREVLS